MGRSASARGTLAPRQGPPRQRLTPAAANGGKMLSYADLKALRPLYPDREPTREIELSPNGIPAVQEFYGTCDLMIVAGNMERYVWSMNGVKLEDAEPIPLRYGERVRFKFVNDQHPGGASAGCP